MAHTGAVLEVLWLWLSSMFVFDVCLPDHYIAERVVYGVKVLPFGGGYVLLLYSKTCLTQRSDFEIKHTKEYLKCVEVNCNQ